MPARVELEVCQLRDVFLVNLDHLIQAIGQFKPGFQQNCQVRRSHRSGGCIVLLAIRFIGINDERQQLAETNVVFRTQFHTEDLAFRRGFVIDNHEREIHHADA